MATYGKEAEVRARVTQEMFNGLQDIATARGEQLPVILREACAEYLARRLAGAPSVEKQTIMDALQENPAVTDTLIKLGKMLERVEKPNSPSPAARTVDEITSPEAVRAVKALYRKVRRDTKKTHHTTTPSHATKT